MKFLVLILMIGCIEPEPVKVWTGTGHVSFKTTHFDTVSARMEIHGNRGYVAIGRITDSLFNVTFDGFTIRGSVYGKFDTSVFEFVEFDGRIQGSYSGLDRDNADSRVRWLSLVRE